MPPCNRLPCDQRCVRILHCGHQCPSLCGETCPEQYCQECSNRQDQRVDLLEMKSYKEIDLTESPIVVLGCGHFFTAETLDGLMGMAEVYIDDGHGKFVGLKDLSCALAGPVPRCPDCQCVVRQFATQRFNRVINRAVIDEMSKRFLVNGQMNLRESEQKVSSMEPSLEATKQAIVNPISPANPSTQGHLTRAMQPDVTSTLRARYNRCREVEKAVDGFLHNVADKHQPAHKLHAATVHAARTQPLEHSMATLTVEDSISAVERDRRVILGGRAAKLKTEYIMLVDKFEISGALRSTTSTSSVKISGSARTTSRRLCITVRLRAPTGPSAAARSTPPISPRPSTSRRRRSSSNGHCTSATSLSRTSMPSAGRSRIRSGCLAGTGTSQDCGRNRRCQGCHGQRSRRHRHSRRSLV